MSDLNSLLLSVIDFAQGTIAYYADANYPIIIGNTPPTNGVSMFVSSGSANITNLDKGMLASIHIMANSKHTNQEMAFDMLSHIHKCLTKARAYRNTENYQITDIATFSYPSLIAREDNGSYVFGSTLEVRFYWR